MLTDYTVPCGLDIEDKTIFKPSTREPLLVYDCSTFNDEHLLCHVYEMPFPKAPKRNKTQKSKTRRSNTSKKLLIL